MNAVEIAGIAGAVMVLSAYALTSTRPVPASSKSMAVMNLGAGALAVNSAAHHAWPSMALNAVWFLVAATVVLRRPTPRPLTADASEPPRVAVLPAVPELHLLAR